MRVLLIGHGSRDRAGNAQFLDLARRMGAEPAFLDHASPDIQEGIDRLVAQGVVEIAVMPLFLSAAGHAKRDVPGALARAAARHPGLQFHLAPVLGVDPALAKIAAAHLPPDAAVLLVGRGSSDAEANEGLFAVGRLIQAESGCQAVVPAYCDVAAPGLDEGVRRCVESGARRVVVLPYFLFKGVLMERLRRLTDSWQQQYPHVVFQFSGEDGLAAHPAFEALLRNRLAFFR